MPSAAKSIMIHFCWLTTKPQKAAWRTGRKKGQMKEHKFDVPQYLSWGNSEEERGSEEGWQPSNYCLFCLSTLFFHLNREKSCSLSLERHCKGKDITPAGTQALLLTKATYLRKMGCHGKWILFLSQRLPQNNWQLQSWPGHPGLSGTLILTQEFPLTSFFLSMSTSLITKCQL